MPSCKLRQDEKRESSEANCPLAEIEEVAQVDAYADPSTEEDTAAYALSAPAAAADCGGGTRSSGRDAPAWQRYRYQQ